MDLYDICFGGLTEGYVEFSIGGVKATQRKWVAVQSARKLFIEPPQKSNVFFGPTLRKEPGKMGKGNCSKSQVCWVDVDSMNKLVSVLPPTAEVMSGHGWHLYWAMDPTDDLRKVEQANQSLAKYIKGDSAHNIDRILRIPGTTNSKDGQDPITCSLREVRKARRYSLQSLLAVSSIPDQIVVKILTGDQRGYRSESERDWAIVRALVDAGMDNQAIATIFFSHPCGSKFRTDGKSYLLKTIQEARSKGKQAKREAFQEAGNCYYIISRGTSKQVSTFTIEPTMLLQGDQDHIMGTVRANGDARTWENVAFPRSAFSGMRQLSKHLPYASWAWLGTDADVRRILAYLNRKMQKESVPIADSTHVLGYHVVGDVPYFVTNDGIVTVDGRFVPTGTESPIVYVDMGRERPHLTPKTRMDDEDYEDLSTLLPNINTPGKIWPMIGWHMASPMKVQLAKSQYKFPILQVCGTRGSGKTATIQQIFQPLLGYSEPVSYDVGTTKFVALSLMGSTNCIPISFSEFRASTSLDIQRYIRLAYDIGKDARGRADQTTQEYPLLAPFVIDGEDKIDDPAILERSIIVAMDPRSIKEFDDPWEAFRELQGLNLTGFALPYLSYTLRLDVDILLDEAEQEIQECFERSLPDRIRRNLVVVWLGIKVFGRFMEENGAECLPDEGPAVLTECLHNVFSAALERAPMAADDYIEYIANQVAQGRELFAHSMESGILWFQHASAYEAYTVQRRRQGREVLSKAAILGQLGELIGEYLVGPQVRILGNNKALAYGIVLEKAKDCLDVPSTITTNSLTITW